MDTRNAYTALASAGSVRVEIVDGPSAFSASSAQPVVRGRQPGALTRLGFGRSTELALLAANATIWTWVAALPVSLA